MRDVVQKARLAVPASVLMSVLQPAYALAARAGGPEDRGTFIRNVGSV